MSWNEKEFKQALEREVERVSVRPDALPRLRARVRRRRLAPRVAVISAIAVAGALAIVGILPSRPARVTTVTLGDTPSAPPGTESSRDENLGADQATQTTGGTTVSEPMFSPTASPSPLPECSAADFALSLSLDRERYGEGHPVEMTLVVRNASGRSCAFWGGARYWDFKIYEKGSDSPIWSDAACKAFPAYAEQKRWLGGEKRTFETVWDRMKNDYSAWQRPPYSSEECRIGGGPAAPGSYEAIGEFWFDNGLPLTNPDRREFRLRTAPVIFSVEG